MKATTSLGATTSSGRNLHKDDPIEAWDEAAARIRAQGTACDADLTGESLRTQTMLADEILAQLICEESVLARFARHGFHFGHTGGSCTAFIRVCPDGSEIWVTLADPNGYPDCSAPEEHDEPIVAGTYPVGAYGAPVETYTHDWHGTAGAYLALLDACETVLGGAA
jgi:hypothetical protein